MNSLIPPQFMIVVYVIVAVAVAGAGFWAYGSIYDRGYSAASAAYEKKAADLKEANDKAIASAEKVLREDIAGLKLQKENLENEVKRLDAEASADPDAASCSLKRSSVQRLNAIR